MAREIIYKEEGYAQTGAVIGLVVGVGVAILVLILVGVMGGQAYTLVEPQINAINNSVIKTSITDAVTNAFAALKTTGQYMPLIVLAVLVGLVIVVIVRSVSGASAATSAL